MGLPSINIIFKTLASLGIQRLSRGVVAVYYKDSTATTAKVTELRSINDIPTDATETVKTQMKLALLGGENAPSKVYFVQAATFEAAKPALAKIKFDWLAVVNDVAGTADIISWVGAQRDAGKRIKVVVADTASDKAYVVNYTSDGVVSSYGSFDAPLYTGRIASLIAGTNPRIATTYQVLTEATEVTSYTDINTNINNGEFVIFNDGEKIKVGRGVTSMKTVPTGSSVELKKIKILEIVDMIYNDLYSTMQDNYIGKIPNTYDNKVLIIRAIKNYFGTLEIEELLHPGSDVGIDLVDQRAYLAAKGVNVDSLTEQELKEHDTDDQLFLQATVKPVDAIEDIKINVYM